MKSPANESASALSFIRSGVLTPKGVFSECLCKFSIPWLTEAPFPDPTIYHGPSILTPSRATVDVLHAVINGRPLSTALADAVNAENLNTEH